MTANNYILRVAVPAPLRCLFDYLPPEKSDIKNVQVGMRLSIPFGKRKNVVGILVAITQNSACPKQKLKKVNYVIDQTPIFDKPLLDLIIWTSRYYHHPIGEVFCNALPVWLRKKNQFEKLQRSGWQLTRQGRVFDLNQLKRAPEQTRLLHYLKQRTEPMTQIELASLYPKSKKMLSVLEKKGLIEKINLESTKVQLKIDGNNLSLNKDQKTALKEIKKSIGTSTVFLLDGVTGSGKTEVYLSAIELVITSNKQSLVLLPEIGLIPQFAQRFKSRFDCEIAIQHSSLSEFERAKYWHTAKTGEAKIILGTRSAIWTPLANPGLFIIDEEHDPSYKQQDRFYYSARDILIIRASKDKVPIILGSATPSLESLYNARKHKYRHLVLPVRAGPAKPPAYRLLDMRGKKMHGPLSQILIDEMAAHLHNKNQVLLFLNRRGYAVNLFCHQCGWKAECPRCDTPYTYHKVSDNLICHHCDSHKQKIISCPECNGLVNLLGHGTERIEEILEKIFPDKTVTRIDRDTTRKKEAMSSMLKNILSGNTDILIGTQMLAKGHHFPNVTLTAIVDADRGLFSTDFRASERFAQLFMQVSGRTGRERKTGTVIVQTYSPDHPLFHHLIKTGYNHCSKTLLQERKSTDLPPYTHMALLKAEAHNFDDAQEFLTQAFDKLKKYDNNNLSVFGPIPAMIEKRSGRFRLQLTIQSNSRNALHKNLDDWLIQLESMKLSKKIRWSLDIDPQDMA